ncbi:aminoacyl-tRNA hydrolase [Candidatus Palauibacter sp.]|uniref:aminoacyl-tRNA hydrolase n=1 Tax=Candidatus Palauibacter sp. TaxID=3101350 RepID=UPI003C6F554A
MRLVLALGNPGREYRDTRHNVGWWLADRLVRRWGGGRFRVEGTTAWAAAATRPDIEVHKPLTYMNRSGAALAALLSTRWFDPGADMLVLVDDVALPVGRFRVRRSGAPGGHNGLTSLSATLGHDGYPRLRLGVGRPADDRIDLAAWVLARMPRAEEEAALGAFPRAAEAVEHWLEHGVEATMNRFNQPLG